MSRLLTRIRHVDWSGVAELAVLSSVLAIAALTSYTHLRDVWIAAGSPWPDLGPLIVDGLFAAAWLRMRRRRRQEVSVGLLAWVALLLALFATIAGNLSAAWIAGHRDVLSLVVAAWPAFAFALVWELVTGHGRKPSTPSTTDHQESPPTVETGGETWAAKRDRLLLAKAGRKRLMTELGITEHQARKLLEARAAELEDLEADA